MHAAEVAAQKVAVEESKTQNPFDGFKDPSSAKFALADLQGKFPEGVKSDKKEYYLSDADFQEAFKMPIADYEKLKLWKQQDLKKKAGLF